MSDIETVLDLLRIGRDHRRYDQIRIACVVVYGEAITAHAEKLLG